MKYIIILSLFLMSCGSKKVFIERKHSDCFYDVSYLSATDEPILVFIAWQRPDGRTFDGLMLDRKLWRKYQKKDPSGYNWLMSHINK